MGREVEFVDNSTVRFEREAPCAVERAWRAVSDADELAIWFIPAVLDARRDGRFVLEGAWSGRISEFVPERRIVFAADAGGTSAFDLLPGATGTRIVLTDAMAPDEHPPGGSWPEGSSHQPGGPGSHWAGVLAGWHEFMNALVRHLGGDAPEEDMGGLTERYVTRLDARFGA